MRKLIPGIPYEHGFPVVNAENIFEVVSKLGINPWKKKEQTIPLSDYLKRDFSEDQRKDLRFAPQSEVMFLETSQGDSYTAFRSVGRDWTTVFSLLPGYLVPLVAEYKHGAEVISIVPPSGVPTKEELAQLNRYQINVIMAQCAEREYEEETGIRLKTLVPLGPDKGLPISSRQSTQRYFPFLGYPEEPIKVGSSKLDDNENLAVILMPISELLRYITREDVTEECLISMTFLALTQLSLIRLDIL